MFALKESYFYCAVTIEKRHYYCCNSSLESVNIVKWGLLLGLGVKAAKVAHERGVRLVHVTMNQC